MVNWEQDSDEQNQQEADYLKNHADFQSQPSYRSNKNGDLLSQIASEDILEDGKKRKTTSFATAFLVGMMRLTLFFDGIKHKHTAVFRLFAIVWGAFISVIYFGGLAALAVLIYSYINFPHFVENYFKNNNIPLATWTVKNYDFSKIELENLQDTEKTYQIKKMTIRSTFSDFLQKKVKSVSLNGVIVKIREKDDQIDVGNLIHLLTSLNQNKSIKIGSVSVMNASLEFEGKNYTLPIQFSMTGFYENKANMSIPLVIKEKNLNISGVLSITGSGNNLNWNLDIMSGTLTLPNRQPENITGKFSFKTDKMRLSGISGNADLSYGGNSKKIKLDLKERNRLFQGNISLSFITKEQDNISKETKSDMVFSFDGIDLKTFTQIESTLPISVNIRSLNTADFSLTNLATTLNGFLSCTDFTCSYQIDNQARISVQSLKIAKKSDTIYSIQPTTFMLEPNHKNNFVFKDQTLMTDLDLNNFSFKGFRNTTELPIIASSVKMAAKGSIALQNDKTTLSVSAQGLNLETPEQELKEASISIGNIWGQNNSVSINTNYLFLKNNNLLKLPFALALTKEGTQTKAQATFLNNLIALNFTGDADFNLGEFKGNIFIPPFDIQKVPENLETVSDLFPGFVQKASGQIAAFGNIHWKSEKQVNGPLYISLKDVNFDTSGIAVKKLNTVLSLQSLVPFVSSVGQIISIEQLGSLLPLQNIVANIKFDNQMLRIFSLDSEVGGIPLSTDNILIPYKASSTVVYLKNNTVDWSSINPYLKTQGLTVLEGSGSIYLPIEIRNGSFSLKNGEIKLTNTRLTYNGKNQKLKNGIFRGNEEYTVRTGNALLTGIPNNLIEAYLSMDGRLTPSMEKQSVKENITINLNDVLKPMPSKPIPESITSKQKIITQ